MPAPIAKGLIIAATVLVAAGIALYEQPQVRQWIDNSRRKLAFALHSLGDDINPASSRRRHSWGADSEDARDAEEQEQSRRRREEIIRRNRAEMVRRAREEGVAVDLDALAAVGRDARQEQGRRSRSDGNRSFDELVGRDGMLRSRQQQQADGGEKSGITTTARQTTGDTEGLRRRGQGAQDFHRGAAFANPFADEEQAQVLFDQQDSAPPKEEASHTSRESTATLAAEDALLDVADPDVSIPIGDPDISVPTVEPITLVDATSLSPKPDHEPASTTTSSFHSLPSSSHHSGFESDADPFDLEHEAQSAGTLTPTEEEDGFSTSASVVGSVMDVDTLSEAFSEIGSRAGASTPGDWTDVESQVGSEDGHSH